MDGGADGTMDDVEGGNAVVAAKAGMEAGKSDEDAMVADKSFREQCCVCCVSPESIIGKCR